jgi:hypothetical protein
MSHESRSNDASHLAGPVKRLENVNVDIHGVIVNTIQEKTNSRYRIGLSILLNDPASGLITQFIAQRQSEIIREIKLMYDLLVQNSEK